MHLQEILKLTTVKTQALKFMFWFPWWVWNDHLTTMSRSCDQLTYEVPRRQMRQQSDKVVYDVSVSNFVPFVCDNRFDCSPCYFTFIYLTQNKEMTLNKQLQLSWCGGFFLVLKRHLKHQNRFLLYFCCSCVVSKLILHVLSCLSAKPEPATFMLTARISWPATLWCTHWTQTTRPHFQQCLQKEWKAALLCAIQLCWF